MVLPIINHKFVNYVPGFLICDVNSQIYMVLCNNQNLTNSIKFKMLLELFIINLFDMLKLVFSSKWRSEF